MQKQHDQKEKNNKEKSRFDEIWVKFPESMKDTSRLTLESQPTLKQEKIKKTPPNIL